MAKFSIDGPLLKDPLAFAACHNSLLEYGRDNPGAEMVVVVLGTEDGVSLEAHYKEEYHDDLYEYLLEDMMDAGFLASRALTIPTDFMVGVWAAELKYRATERKS